MMQVFSWLFRLSIRRQLVFGVAVVHLLLMTAFVYDLTQRQESFLIDKDLTAGKFQATILAQSSRMLLQTNDLNGLQEVIETFSETQSFNYAMIVSPDGMVLSHSDKMKRGLYLQDSVSIKLLNSARKTMQWKILAENIEFVAPIYADDRLLGWARIQSDNSENTAHISYVYRNGLIYTLIALLAGTIFAIFLAQLVLKQLKLLMNGTERLSKNSLDEPIPIIASNEVGMVSLAFNSAMRELQKKNDEINRSKEQYRQLYDNIPVMHFSLTDNAEISMLNRYAVSELGYLPELLTGKIFLELFPGEDAANINNLLNNCRTEPGRTFYCESKMITGKGQLISTRQIARGVIEDNVFQFLIVCENITAAKQAEAALAESRKTIEENEKKFNAIVNQASDGLALADMTGNYIYVNSSFCKLTGYTEKELLKMNVYDLTLYKPGPNAFRQSKTNRTGKPVTVTLKRKDGSLFTAEITGTPVHFNDTDYVLGAVRDISDRMKFENQLKESEERFRLIANNTGDTITVFDMNMNYVFISPSVQKICGFTPDELMTMQKQGSTTKVQWCLEEKIALSTQRKAAEEPSEQYEEHTITNKIKGKDGADVWVETNISYIKDAENKPVNILAVSRDITDRVLKEEQILILSRAVIQSPVSILITNKNGVIEYVNNRFTQVTGYTQEEAMGNTPKMLKSGKQPPDFYKSMWETILKGELWEGEFENVKKNGEYFRDKTVIAPITDDKGEIIHFVGIKEDVTEKQKMVEDLIHAKNVAEQSSRLKDAFIANISHEIRTPLNGILGMASIIKDLFEERIGGEAENYFNSIDRSSRRIIRTIDMILNYSQLQAGTFSIKPEQLNLRDLITKLTEEFRPVAAKRNLSMGIAIKTNRTVVTADSFAASIVFSNLIDNAIKFTHHGYILIEVTEETNDTVTVIIRDSGVGISEEYIPHIFEPYTQEQIGYNREYEGIGLGLALVKKILDLLNATVQLSSKKGVGTAVTIVFNNAHLSPDAPAGEETTENHPETPPDKPIIASVEDDLIDRQTIELFLSQNYTVIFTDSYKGLLDILKKNKVRLILMDISITGSKNGLEITTELKSGNKYSHIPVLAVTAHAFEQDRLNAVAAGCDDVITKPFSREHLNNKVGDWLVKK